MDTVTLHKNADRVSSIFNALATVVLVVGLAAAVLYAVIGFVNASDSTNAFGSILLGLIVALLVAVYTLITWAGVQLAALVAGYIRVRTETRHVAD